MRGAQSTSIGCLAKTELPAAETTECYRRLQTMALAYQTQGSVLYQRADLQKFIVDALEGLYEYSYNETLNEKGNWWFWEFGIPLSLEDTTVLMYDSLSASQVAKYMRAVDHFLPSPQTSTGGASGANGAWSAQVCTLKSILLQNSDGKLALCRDKFDKLMQYVSGKDGYYTDGSYVGHAHFAYTGGYGLDFLASLGDAFVLYGNPSPFPLDPSRKHIVSEWINRSYIPLLYHGLVPYYVAGREFGRPASTDYSRGLAVAFACIDIANGLPPSQAMIIKRFARSVLANLQKYPSADRMIFSGITPAELRRIDDLMTDDSITPLKKETRSTIFGYMNKVEHNTPNFGFGISMFSTRMQNYEDAGENRHGWHQSDGMTYIFNADREQYDNGYWPTVDGGRLAGTTVNEDDAIPSNQFNQSAFAGGVTLADRYSAVGFILHPAGDTLTAQKAWFLFDKEIVCLGSGITDTHGSGVDTIIENRKFNIRSASPKAGRVTIDGSAYAFRSAEPSSLSQVRWAHLSGSVPGSEIGYWFPKPTALTLREGVRSGSWSDLHGTALPRRHSLDTSTPGIAKEKVPARTQLLSSETGTNSPAILNHFFTMWISHGVNPKDAHYEYVLLPSADSSQVEEYSRHPEISILENTDDAAAVRKASLGLTSILFWKQGTHTIRVGPKRTPYVTADQQVALLIHESDSGISIAAADPTCQFEGVIHIEIARTGRSVVSHDRLVKVTQINPFIRLQIDLRSPESKPGRAVSVTIGR